jgi:hypothetical protein
MRYVAFFALVVFLLSAFSSAEKQKDSGFPEEFKHFATRPCFPIWGKGGVGAINEQVFVLTKTPHNELILRATNDGPDRRWRGKSAVEGQVVFVFEGKVWEADALPGNFNLGKSVVISFEGEKIRIFDFQTEEGCYYLHALTGEDSR